jgi:antitoxin (DNA-binding transcriptional repressor) of toxin-antitoxin stability system
MSAIALPDFERDVRAALARVLRGESLILIDGSQTIAQITPTPMPSTPSKTEYPSSLVDFFLNSPLRDSGIVFDRDRSAERDAIRF